MISSGDRFDPRDYAIDVRWDAEESVWFAYSPQFGEDIHGIDSEPSKAISKLHSFLSEIAAIESEQGRAIPIPEAQEARSYSGRFTIRGKRTTHAALAGFAGEENVTLNAFVTGVLERYVAEHAERRFILMSMRYARFGTVSHPNDFLNFNFGIADHQAQGTPELSISKKILSRGSSYAREI